MTGNLCETSSPIHPVLLSGGEVKTCTASQQTSRAGQASIDLGVESPFHHLCVSIHPFSQPKAPIRRSSWRESSQRRYCSTAIHGTCILLNNFGDEPFPRRPIPSRLRLLKIEPFRVRAKPTRERSGSSSGLGSRKRNPEVPGSPSPRLPGVERSGIEVLFLIDNERGRCT